MGYKLNIIPLALKGAAEIITAQMGDERGWFSRWFCQAELLELTHGLPIQQMNSSFTLNKGTLRGLHFQHPPHMEDKLVRCIQGRVFDVILDLRKNSETKGQWVSVILDAHQQNMLFIPKGFAHGFQTLEDKTQLLYCHTENHAPQSEDGFFYDSPDLNINWPLNIELVSARDQAFQPYTNDFVGLNTGGV